MMKRIATLALALVVALACVPLSGIAEEAGATRAFLVNEDGTETELTAEELEALRRESLPQPPGDIEIDLTDALVDAGDFAAPEEVEAVDITPPEEPVPEAAEPNEAATVPALPPCPGELAFPNGQTGMTGITHNVSITQRGSTVTVTGSIPSPYYLYGLYVDTKLVAPVTGSSVNQTINMNAFDTGYHTVWLGVVQGAGSTSVVDLIPAHYMVSNNITARPSYNGVFEVYGTYFNYYPYSMTGDNMADKLYLEYSSDGGNTWQRSGYMQANAIKLYIEQAYEIGGLKPKTTYKTRIRYGQVVTYSTDVAGDGKSYFFGGPVLNTTTIKTGSATKPAIKSITAKAVNVRYHAVRHYGQYTGVYLYTEKFYTCKIKVTVKLKKKPGTKGMFINGKWVKGNKKTYTKTFSPYPNYYFSHPRGSGKFTVTVRTGQSKKWGGYSPTVSKTKKLS